MLVAAAAAILGVAVLPPLLQVGSELIGSSSSLGLLASGRLWSLFLRSVGLAGAVTVISVAVGVPLGLVFARSAIPFRRTLLGAHLGGVFLPPFLPALGWFHIFGREGWLGSDASSRLLFGDVGVIFVLVACFTPAVTALTAMGVLGVDAALEDAARIVAGPIRTAALVLVPCASPAIALSTIIVFTLSFSELGVPMFLRVNVYPAVVFARLGGMSFAPGEAAVFVLPLLAVAVGLLWAERRFAGRHAVAVLGGRNDRRAPLLGGGPLYAVPAGLGASLSVLPVGALVVDAAAGRGFADLPQWTGNAPWNGLRAATCAAVVIAAIALVVGRGLARGTRTSIWLDGLGTLAFILPSSILGVGLVGAWNRSGTEWLYTGFGILVVGFIARYSAVATRAFAAAVAQVPRSLEEAAQTVGAAYLRRLGLVTSIAWRGAVGAFVLGLVFALRDLETAALYYPPGGEPLTVRIFTLEANGPPPVVSALAVLHVLFTFAVIGVAWAGLHRRARA